MIIHNTTYSVLPETEERWVQWIQREHIPKIKGLPGILSCRFLKLLTEIENDGVTYTIQTEIATAAAGEEYLREYDTGLQYDMAKNFPGQVLSFQSLLKIMPEE